jgi:folate-binding protein YgfZ
MAHAASSDAYERARRHAASIDRSGRGRIVVTGADRASYLQGLLTNDVVALKQGSGCYAAYLTPQGRMIADLYVYELGDLMLITLPGAARQGVLGRFEQFIFSEDVRLGDVTDTFAQIAIVGPESPSILGKILTGMTEASLRALPEHGNARGAFDGDAAIVARVTDTGEPGFDVFVERAREAALQEAFTAHGVPALAAATIDALRIEAGIPEFHRDMDENTIPLEAGIESRAISFSKGCYVGQEVIIRVMHRGHGRVARRLVGLVVEGAAVPAAGSTIQIDGREVGRVTSSTLSPAVGKPIALGYVQRDYTSAGTELSIDGNLAVVTALPFRPGTLP